MPSVRRIAAACLLVSLTSACDSSEVDRQQEPGPNSQTAVKDGVALDLPDSWSAGDECRRGIRPAYFGPDDDPCDTSSYVAFYDAEFFDAAQGPGLLRDRGLWGGYVEMGGLVVVVTDPSKLVASSILESVRADG